MELKEYLKIIKEGKILFLSAVVLVFGAVFAYSYLKPVSWGASLTLNITRSGTQETPDYKFDDFYRLQADEKFAETLVEWLKSPRVMTDIYSTAGIESSRLSLRKLSRAVKPQKLSSQVVGVSFSSPDEKTARKKASAIIEVISKNTKELNKNQKEETWFEVISAEPVIIKDRPRPFVLAAVSLMLGAFIGFCLAMLKHYLKD